MGAPFGDERELLLTWIAAKREDVVATTAGLDAAQLRWTPEGRLLPILGIVNHLTKMEWRWIEGRYAGQPFPQRTKEFVLGPEVEVASVLAAYAAQAAHTERLVREAPSLDVECLGDEGGRGPVHVLLDLPAPVTLRWVLLHVLEETAHHAGHADATREMLDGRKMRT